MARMNRPSIKQIGQTIIDPGRHISLDMGDAIALFVLGILSGVIGQAIFAVPNCWIIAV